MSALGKIFEVHGVGTAGLGLESRTAEDEYGLAVLL